MQQLMDYRRFEIVKPLNTIAKAVRLISEYNYDSFHQILNLNNRGLKNLKNFDVGYSGLEK